MTTLENVDLMTAIITPFDDNDQINYDALERLTNHLLETGSRGFVIGGTTGETPTLSMMKRSNFTLALPKSLTVGYQ